MAVTLSTNIGQAGLRFRSLINGLSAGDMVRVIDGLGRVGAEGLVIDRLPFGVSNVTIRRVSSNGIITDLMLSVYGVNQIDAASIAIAALASGQTDAQQRAAIATADNVNAGLLGVGLAVGSEIIPSIVLPLELQRLTLSAPLVAGQTSSVTITGKTAGSTLSFVRNSLDYLSQFGGMTINGLTLAGQAQRRVYRVNEQMPDGRNRDTLLFAPKAGKHNMRAGIGVGGINYYTPNNVFLDNLKYAGGLTAPATSDANGMPLTLAIDGNGNPGAAYIMTLTTASDQPQNFHILTDGDMDFSGHTKVNNEWVRQQPAGRNSYILNITAIRTPPTYMHYVREDEVALAKTGKTFKASFIAEMAKFSHVRFMNWHGGNFDDQCTTNKNSLIFADQFQVPLDVIIEACTGANVDLYLNVHYKRTTQQFLDNDVPKLDAFIAATGRKVYIEHSNEVWNGVFPQEAGCRAMAQAMGYAGNAFYGSTWWNGYRTAELAKATRGKGYRWLIGVQTAQQQTLAPVLVDGMNQVPGRVDGDIWGYHVSTYTSGSMTLGFEDPLGSAMDKMIADHNYEAIYDNVLTIDLQGYQNAAGQPYGSQTYSIDRFARNDWQDAKQIAMAHGWTLVGYEGNFHMNSIFYSRNPNTYGPVFYDMVEHPLADPATNYCLETAEDAGFTFVTMFDFDGEGQPRSESGRFGLFGKPGYDAVTRWNANLNAEAMPQAPAPTWSATTAEASTFSGAGSRTAQKATAAHAAGIATKGIASGQKAYWEVVMNSATSNDFNGNGGNGLFRTGFAKGSYPATAPGGYLGGGDNVSFLTTGAASTGYAGVSDSGSDHMLADGAVVRIIVDYVANTFRYAVNGSGWITSAPLPSGTTTLFPAFEFDGGCSTAASMVGKFSAADFSYAVPAGFTALASL